MPKKKENLSLEEKLQKAVIPKDEEPYIIPDNWIWTKLSEIVDVKGGKRIPKGQEFSKTKTKNIYLRVTDFKNRGIYLENLKYISDEVAEKIKNYRITSKDIYLSIAGTIGKVGIIPKEVENSFLTENACKLVNISNMEQKYLLNLLETSLIKKEIKNSITSSGQPKLAIFRIGNFPIPLPPLEEQKRIVEKLDSLFEKTQKIKEIIEEVKEKMISKREAILSKAFTGELTEKWRSKNETSNTEELLYKINDEKIKLWEEECKKAEEEGRKKPKKPQIKDISEMLVKEDEVPYKIPENWVWIRLDNISEKISKGTTPKGGESAYVKNGIKFLRVENITKNYKLDLDKIKYISNETHVSFLKRSILEENDLLISIAGSLGRTAVISKDNLPLNTNQAIAFIRFLVKDKSFSKFFSYFFNTRIIKTLLLEQAKVTAIPNLTLEILSKTKILLPPLEEQKEIVRILDKVFEEEDKIDELLKLEESIAALESSILDKAFKGELGTQNKDDYPILERLKEIL